MSRILILIFLFSTVAFADTDWRSTLSPATPGKIPMPRPFVATYGFGWAGFTAGRADATFSRQSGSRLRLEVKGGTTGIVRVLWHMDAQHTSIANASTLLPVSMRQEEIYSGETLKTELNFTGNAVTGTIRKTSADKTSLRQVHYVFPALRDMHTALLFVGSQKLEPGQTFNFVVYPATSPFLVTAHVVGKEKVEVPAGNYNSTRVDLRLWKITKDFHLEPPPKCKHAIVWVSDDADRLPLKAEADVFIGSVWGELEKVRFLKP